MRMRLEKKHLKNLIKMGSNDQDSKFMRKGLFFLSCILFIIGFCGGPLITRLYFIHGGRRKWLSTCLQTAGFPIILVPLAISYFHRRKTEGPNTKLILMKLRIFLSGAILGVLVGLGDYLSTIGLKNLPVSTANLIAATSLVFTAISAFFLVKQKFTPYSINAIVLLTVGAAVLGMHASSDKPKGESNKSYVLGFVMMFLFAASTGLLMPLVELVYKKAKQKITYTLVMEFQVVISLSATLVSTVGMLINNDFKAIPREAKEYELGQAKYYTVLVANAIIWQFLNWGAFGIVFSSSALFSSIYSSVLLPISEVLAVVCYHDKFGAEKGVALVLCLWGFSSNLYGDIQQNKVKNDQIKESEITNPINKIQESEITPAPDVP